MIWKATLSHRRRRKKNGMTESGECFHLWPGLGSALVVRNELRYREHAHKVLAGSLGVYGLAHVVVILVIGPGALD
jgi:DNA polymerase elongation subunit (family B)